MGFGVYIFPVWCCSWDKKIWLYQFLVIGLLRLPYESYRSVSFEPPLDKTNKNDMCIQRRHRSIRPVWSESSLSAWINLWSLATHWANREDSYQTGRMPRMIWVFAGHTCHFVGFVMRRLICQHLSHITRKRVFGDFRLGKIQTSLLSYRS